MSDKDASAGVDQQQALDKADNLPKSATEKEQTKALGDYNPKLPTNQYNMRVKVYSPFRDYFDDYAVSVTAENATGPFDVLARHHNFITLLSPCELVVRTADKAEQKIRISGGIMHVKADKVIIFLDV